MSTGDGFVYWFYVDDQTKLQKIKIYLTTDVTWTKHFFAEDVFHVETGWNKRLFSKDDLVNVGGDSFDDPIIKIRFNVQPEVGQNVSVSFDNLRYGLLGHAKIIMVFDDIHDSCINNAKPIMDGNSQRGVCGVVPTWLGNPNRMVLANLITLKNAGWDMANHTMTHVDLTAASPAELETEVNGAYNWLVANVGSVGAKYFMYPFSAYNTAVLAKVKQHHVLGRAGSRSLSRYHVFAECPYDFQLLTHNIPFTAGKTAAQIKAQIDRVISVGGLGVIMLHDVVAAGPSADGCLTADFLDVSNYIKTKQDADVLEVMSMSDYYDSLPK